MFMRFFAIKSILEIFFLLIRNLKTIIGLVIVVAVGGFIFLVFKNGMSVEDALATIYGHISWVGGTLKSMFDWGVGAVKTIF